MTHSGNYYLDSLKMENFRQYVRAEIKFSRTPGAMFTILRGSNGSGKTNIMNAITWCLYGSERHLDSNESSLPIVNKKTLKDKPTGLIRTKVEINLVNESGDKVKIERELTLLNSGQMDVQYDKAARVLIPAGSTPTVKQSFQWFDLSSGGWQSTDYVDVEVQSVLPEDLSSYFLFDGEQLESLFEQTDDVKKGIEDVSEIGIMEQAIGRLKNIIRTKTKTSKQIDPQVQQYQDLVDETEAEIDSIDSEIKKINDKQNVNMRRIKEIETYMQKTGGEVGNYNLQEKLARKDIEVWEAKYRDLDSKLKDHVLEHAVYVQADSAVRKTLTIIDEKINTGMLPPKIQDTFLKQLLKDNRCICGNDISVGKPRELVTQHLTKAQYTGINAICTDLKYNLHTNLINVRATLTDFEKEANRQESILCDLRKKLKDLGVKLGRINNIDIQKLYRERELLTDENRNLAENKGRKDSDKYNREMDLKNYKTKLDKAYDEAKKHKRLTSELDFCHKTLGGLEVIKNELIDDVRSDVQRYTKIYFLQFLWKKNAYVDVNIDENYNIAAQDVDGYRVRENLSKGEKLILALAFMAALRKIKGFGFPLIIDTPLGRVSGETRYNIARTLPDFLRDEQVVLLVTDAEYQAQIHDDENRQMFPAVQGGVCIITGRTIYIIHHESTLILQ